MKEVTTVVTEKKVVYTLRNINAYSFLRSFLGQRILLQGSKSMTSSTQTANLFEKLSVSIETKMEQIKDVVMEKNQFEYRDRSLLVAGIGFCRF